VSEGRDLLPKPYIGLKGEEGGDGRGSGYSVRATHFFPCVSVLKNETLGLSLEKGEFHVQKRTCLLLRARLGHAPI